MGKEHGANPPLQDWERGLGSCLSYALSQAGITIEGDIGEWLTIEQAKDVCEQAGLDFYDADRLQGKELHIAHQEPVIAIYITREGRSHAEYVQDLGGLVGRGAQFIGMIRLQDR